MTPEELLELIVPSSLFKDAFVKDYVQDINKEELFEGLLAYGLFVEKIPPFLTSKPFYDWCIKITDENIFKEEKKQKNNGDLKCLYKATDFVRYENMRNINIPRSLAIPNPIAYRNLCKTLADCWEDLQKYFKDKTQNQQHKISRIHLRKLKDKKHLFEMNYKNFEMDGDPEIDLSIGSRILAKADISNCFPSIYTHSIPWALVGKKTGKQERGNSKYFNKIDKAVRDTKYGETHGILIGPHASNLISEIILVAVDKELYDKGYRYIRNIDDYSCYLESHDKAEQFLLDLSSALKQYELTLNHKKTEILELPIASVENWVRKLNTFYFSNKKTDDAKFILTFKEMVAYLDFAIELMLDNNNNIAILNYAIKVISKRYLGQKAKQYYLKRIHHLILLYPYLILLLENHLFVPFSVSKEKIQEISNTILKLGLEKNLWEAISYSLYFSIKYDFVLENTGILFKQAKESDDCIFLLLAYLYEKKQGTDLTDYKTLAKSKKADFDRFWLFVYEVLEASDLDEAFKKMKSSSISFIK